MVIYTLSESRVNNMDGVTILTVKDVVAESFHVGIGTIVGLSIFIISVIIGIIFAIRDKDSMPIFIIGLLGLFIGVMMFLLTGALFSFLSGYEKVYQVTIDETVSMAEFYDTYDVLSVDGKIYTVKEKNNDTD